MDLLVDSARRALTLGQDVMRVEGRVWEWVVLVLVLGMTTELAESSRAKELRLLAERMLADNVEVLTVLEGASQKAEVEKRQRKIRSLKPVQLLVEECGTLLGEASA